MGTQAGRCYTEARRHINSGRSMSAYGMVGWVGVCGGGVGGTMHDVVLQEGRLGNELSSISPQNTNTNVQSPSSPNHPQIKYTQELYVT